jgi:hypothetical protein
MMRMLKSGEPDLIEPINRGEWVYNIECCDCGAVHFFIFTKLKKRLQIKGFRDDYATEKARDRIKKNK